MSDAFLDADLSAWVSKTESRSDRASGAVAARLAALLDREASSTGTLFPLGHWLQFTPEDKLADLGADGHPQLGGFLPPLPLPRRMWAGSTITFHSPIVAGQEIVRTTTIEAITPKTGASGRLCFVVLCHDVVADGAAALTERQTLVYREDAPADPDPGSARRAPRTDAGAPEGWEWVHSVRPDELMLFRYSALTFNAHRIHYDLPYAVDIERYPGLVVHGPLSATLLVDGFLRHHPDAEIVEFSFSARAPLFAQEQLYAVGRDAGRTPDGRRHTLEMIGPDGSTAVVSELTFR